jgi:hypothetical protein
MVRHLVCKLLSVARVLVERICGVVTRTVGVAGPLVGVVGPGGGFDVLDLVAGVAPGVVLDGTR